MRIRTDFKFSSEGPTFALAQFVDSFVPAVFRPEELLLPSGISALTCCRLPRRLTLLPDRLERCAPFFRVPIEFGTRLHRFDCGFGIRDFRIEATRPRQSLSWSHFPSKCVLRGVADCMEKVELADSHNSLPGCG